MTANNDSDLVFVLFNEIGIINQLATAEFLRVLERDLSMSEFSVLNHFARLGTERTPTWLARAFQMSKASMTAIVAKLEAKGYVEVRGAPEDRRQKFVWITPAGRSARDRAVAAIHPVASRMLAELGKESLLQLKPQLAALRAYLDASRNERDGL